MSVTNTTTVDEKLSYRIGDHEFVENSKLIQLADHNLPRLYLSTFFLRSAFGVVTLLLPIYLAQLYLIGGPEFSKFEIGLIVGSIFLSEIALVTVFGRLSDITGRRRPFIVMGNIIAAISFAMFSIFEGFVGLFIAHLIEGIGAAMVMGPTLAMIGESSTVDKHGEKMGLFETATFGGMAFGFFVSGLFYDTLLGGIEEAGRWTFAISSLFLVIGAFLAFQLLEPAEGGIDIDWGVMRRFYRETVHHRPMLLFPLSSFLLLTSLSTIILVIQGEFSLVAAIFAEGLNPQITTIIYGAAAVLFFMGLLDFYFELSMSSEDKKPLRRGRHQSHVGELIEALKDSELKKILLAWYLVMIILGTIVTFLPIILNAGINEPGDAEIVSADAALSKGLEAFEIGLFFVFGAAVLGAMQIFFGKMVDRYGRRPILLLGLLSIVLLGIEVISAFVFFPYIFNDIFSGSGLAFLVIASITGLGVSAFGPAALTVLADNSQAGNRGVTAGIYSLLLALGHLTGDILGGFLYDIGEYFAGTRGGAIAIFVFILICALLALLAVINIQKPVVRD